MRRTFASLIIGAFLATVCSRGGATSPADCRFDPATNDIDAEAGDFCGWHPNDNDGPSIWHTGDAVLVDAANFVTRDTPDDKSDDVGAPASHRNRFAYAQGGYGAPTAAALEGPLLPATVGGGEADLSLVYWKLAPLPALDICVHEVGAPAYALNCVDAVAGPGQQQWIRRTVELPAVGRPYKIILRARDLLSAEDIICVDDIRLSERREPNRRAPLRDEFVHGYRSVVQEQQRQQQQQSDGHPEQPSEKYYDSDKAEPEDAKIHASDFVGQSLEPLRTPSAGASAGVVPRQRQSSIRPQTRRPLTVFYRTAAAAAAAPWRTAAVAEPATGAPSSCPAVKCTFLESACAWTLGHGWRKSDAASIVCETAGEDDARSAPFQAPLGSLFEFDLWMSDNAVFTVTEEDVPLPLAGAMPPPPAPPAIFTYSGASGAGFRRFRVPLRPTFLPVRLRLRCRQPAGAFVAVANTQLVDGRADEIQCRDPATVATPPLTAFADLFSATLPPFPTLIPPLGAVPSTVAPPMPFAPVMVATAAAAPIFNPFQPMLGAGLAPIVPIKSHPTRLTALQKSAENTPSDDSQSADKMPKSNDKMSTVRPLDDPNEYGNESTIDENNNNNNEFDDNKVDASPYVNLNRDTHVAARIAAPQSQVARASGDRIRPAPTDDDRIRPTTVEQRDAPPAAVGGTDSNFSVLETFIRRLTGGQPHLDRPLMQLAERFGVSALPRDPATLDAIGALLGGQRGGEKNAPLPSQLAALLPLLGGGRQAARSSPPPSPFEAPETQPATDFARYFD